MVRSGAGREKSRTQRGKPEKEETLPQGPESSQGEGQERGQVCFQLGVPERDRYHGMCVP